jgi:hypothetical protein
MMTVNVNRFQWNLSDDDRAAINAAVATLNDKLLPRLAQLTPADRRNLPKMGDKTVAFVRKAADYARGNPGFAPAYFSTTGMDDGLSVIDELTPLVRRLGQVVQALDDTVLLVGSDAYTGGLSYYQSVKGAAKARHPGALPIADDLAQRFSLARPKAQAIPPLQKPAAPAEGA